MNQLQLTVAMDPSKPYLGVVGCSYSHWSFDNCLGESYPGLIAKNYPDYNVVDLSIISAGNDSAFFRLHTFEKQNNIKFTKIIFQLTHFYRELIFLDYNKDDILWKDPGIKENLFYTKGRWSKHGNFDVKQINGSPPYKPFDDRDTFSGREGVSRNELADYFDIKSTDLYKYYINKMGSNQPLWICEKEIDHINSHYGIDNVLIFGWHRKIDLESTSTNFFAYVWDLALGHADGDKSNKESDLEIDLPKNYIGSIEDMLGTKEFWELAVDEAPHYGVDGHMKVYTLLEPNIQELLKG